MTSQQDVIRVRDLIDHTCDGPVTRFVLIHRATELVAKGENATVVAEALYEALTEGFMDHDDNDGGV